MGSPISGDSDMNLAGWTKRITGKPTITVGSVGLNRNVDFVNSITGKTADVAGIDELLERLGKGEFDLVAAGRALIANPEWPARVREGRSSILNAFSKDILTTLN
jgi:2,4-dienoyl-CoA reductase-like NADH-dependent reductase (Old Yellow Enzyme family)